MPEKEVDDVIEVSKEEYDNFVALVDSLTERVVELERIVELNNS